MSDIHLDLNYREDCGFPLCLDLGWYKKDPPLKLVETLLDDMSFHYDNIDAILIQGDSIVHGLSYPETEHAWPMQKETLIFLRNAIAERFPYTPVLLSIGNNDVLEHY